jgi:hypothetical protein
MKLDALCYYHDKTPRKIPLWAGFFTQVGEYIGFSKSDSRMIIGITIPTRAYSSCLIALGIVNSAYKRVSNNFDIDKHFKELCGLEIGTPIVYLENNRQKIGLFDGCDVVCGEPAIRILTREKDNSAILLTRKLSVQAWVAESQVETISDRQIGYRLYSSGEFINSFLESSTAHEFITKASYEALIIGQINTLKNEIVETGFSIEDNGNFYSGTLQDILRVRKFMGAKEAYWTDVTSISTSFKEEQIPKVIIFDGANGFLRHSHVFRRSHQIVIIEYTDTDFEAAVDAIMKRFIQYRSGIPKIDFITSPPSGIEIIAFEEGL